MGEETKTTGPIVSPLLTEAEAIHYLRLDEPGGPRHPEATLRYFRQMGLVRGIRISRHIRYPVWELEAFIKRLLERRG